MKKQIWKLWLLILMYLNNKLLKYRHWKISNKDIENLQNVQDIYLKCFKD